MLTELNEDLRKNVKVVCLQELHKLACKAAHLFSNQHTLVGYKSVIVIYTTLYSFKTCSHIAEINEIRVIGLSKNGFDLIVLYLGMLMNVITESHILLSSTVIPQYTYMYIGIKRVARQSVLCTHQS